MSIQSGKFSSRQVKVLIAGGGTGGHVYPALAIAKELKYRHVDWDVFFAGRHDTIEGKAVPAEGFVLHELYVKGYERYYSRLKKLSVIKTAARAVKDSFAMLKEFTPDIVIGTGGYICGPIVMAAVLKGIPTLISEQNVIPGFTIKMLSRFAKRVCLPFEDARQHMAHADRCVLTGNPVRREFALYTREMSRKTLNLPDSAKLILAFGGSLGAARINNAVLGLIKTVQDGNTDAVLIHITGRDGHAAFMEDFAAEGLTESNNVRILDYSNEMPMLLNAADVVISRAGAMSVSEINYVGVPAIYVPYPVAVFDHQMKNAQFCAGKGAAILIKDEDCTKENLSSTILALLRDPHRLQSMASASFEIGIRDSSERIAIEAEKLIVNAR